MERALLTCVLVCLYLCLSVPVSVWLCVCAYFVRASVPLAIAGMLIFFWFGAVLLATSAAAYLLAS